MPQRYMHFAQGKLHRTVWARNSMHSSAAVAGAVPRAAVAAANGTALHNHTKVFF